MAASADGLLYEGAFGKRESGGDVDMTLDTVFHLASMTKAVTCVAAMQQVERGLIDLDEPIGRFVPELAAPHVLDGFDAAGAPILRSARRPITLRLLLSHTSGFAYDTWNGEIRRYMQVNGIPSIGAGQAGRPDGPARLGPGHRWEYGIGIDWAGQAVERTSGLDLEAYFRDEIFEPLGMTDTGFLLRADQRARKAGVHQRTGPPRSTSWTTRSTSSPSSSGAAAASTRSVATTWRSSRCCSTTARSTAPRSSSRDGRRAEPQPDRRPAG